ncbi:unnamed protein product [Bursaphelenchus okinawaensis]|uniref:phosphoethanolamine N-methyltransferase n=1 Tax=Bursaphelenchus okinawaensis TaxID=465554 RepID=A0A811L638_9BILA|nr:unnamed protein product [Bursaphelenchus okinawaensis]CAG9118495.1 unnamed protein product [Bursaphelenchus okinawaensis]
MAIPSEVIETVSYQLPELKITNALLISEDDVSIPNVPEAAKVRGVTVEELKNVEADSHELVIINRLSAGETHKQNLDKILQNSLRILKTDGVVVAYEDFENVTYQEVGSLSTLFDSFESKENGNSASFKLLAMNQTSEQTSEGVYWIMTKYTASDDENMVFRSFLDHTQYVPENIEAYEWIFGREFISPGGVNMNRRVFSEFDDLEPGKKMLDIGSGLGGSVRQIARDVGLKVTACDISANMMALGILRHRQRPVDGVTYMLADVMRYKFKPESFDYVYTKDCIHHIFDLPALLTKIREILKPGGQLIITMYGRGYGPFTEEFKEFVNSRRYYLNTVEEMEEKAKNAGFSEVEATNITPMFKEWLEKERNRAIMYKDEFLKNWSEKKYNSLFDGWTQKLDFIKADNHNWLKIKCTK